MEKWQTGLIAICCIIAALVFVIVVPIGWTTGTYNDLVTKEEKVANQWSEVTNQYQRKIDLIDQLVNMSREYANYENSTLEQITSLRTQWNNPQPGQDLEEATDQFDDLANSIIIQVEAYPELVASELYLSTMDTIAGTENRITVARMNYNEAVRDYNTQIRQFPDSMVANTFGFEKKVYFQSSAGPNQPGS